MPCKACRDAKARRAKTLEHRRKVEAERLRKREEFGKRVDQAIERYRKSNAQ